MRKLNFRKTLLIVLFCFGITLLAAPGPVTVFAVGVPPAPTGVVASDGAYTDKIHVSWDCNATLTNYWVKVKRSTTYGGSETQVGSFWNATACETVSFDDPAPTPGKTYWYSVYFTYDQVNNGQNVVDTGWYALPDLSTSPLTASTNNPNYIKLHASADVNVFNTLDGYYQYYYYRAPFDSDVYTLITSGYIDSYNDSTASYGYSYKYIYKLCFEDSISRCSPSSDPVYGWRPLEWPPENVQASDGLPNEVAVTWEQTHWLAQPITYSVYRSDNGGSSYGKIGDTTDLIYHDTTAAVGTVYYYVVKSCSSSGCSLSAGPDTGFVGGSGRADFDGDGVTDLSIRRGGKWYINGLGNFSWGIPTDIPVPGDYDGDGAAEAAVYRDGKWFIKDIGTINYGIPGDIPVPADYDGDGTIDIAVRRGAKFYIQGIGNFSWGLATDIPVPADYDGDGAAEIAVFRDGKWFIKDIGTTNFGIAGDLPVPADYDGDGTTDIAIRRGGKFFIMGIGNFGWGIATDVPVPGDYDGDGAADIAVFRDGKWFIMGVGNFNFGIAGDYPLPAPDTNADGDPYQ